MRQDWVWLKIQFYPQFRLRNVVEPTTTKALPVFFQNHVDLLLPSLRQIPHASLLPTQRTLLLCRQDHQNFGTQLWRRAQNVIRPLFAMVAAAVIVQWTAAARMLAGVFEPRFDQLRWKHKEEQQSALGSSRR